MNKLEEFYKYLEAEKRYSINTIKAYKRDLTDLNNYLIKKSEEKNSKSQIETVALLNKINSYKSQLKTIEIDLNNAKSAKVNLLSLRKAASDKFYGLGGIDKETQKLVAYQMEQISKQREEMNKNLRSYIEEDLPLFLNLDILNDAQVQALLEKRAKYPRIVNELEDFLGEDLSFIKKMLEDRVINCPIIHNLTDEETDRIGDKIFNLIANAEVASKIIRKRNSSLDEYKVMKNRVLNNENIEIFSELLEEIKKIDIALMELETQIDEFKSKYSLVKSELDLSYQIYDKLTEDIKKSSLYDSSFVLGNDCLKICEIYSDNLTKRKLKQVSSLALQIFDETIRKNDFKVQRPLMVFLFLLKF